MKLRFFFILICCFFTFFNSKGQNIVHQDIFRGGVTGDGFNSAFLPDTGEFILHLDGAGSIRNAFLFCNMYATPSPKFINFDGNIVLIDSSMTLNNKFEYILSGSDFFKVQTLIIDVKNYININQNVYSFVPPFNQVSPTIGGGYIEFYLFVTYL